MQKPKLKINELKPTKSFEICDENIKELAWRINAFYKVFDEIAMPLLDKETIRYEKMFSQLYKKQNKIITELKRICKDLNSNFKINDKLRNEIKSRITKLEKCKKQ